MLCPVSYTHLDVYKRQAGDSGSGQSGIPEEWAQVALEAPMTAGDFSGMTLSDWLEKGAEILRESLHEPLRLLARLCGLLLLAAVGKSMCTERTSPELAGLVDTVVTLAVFTLCSSCTVSYTHLDVYKRQVFKRAL